MTRLWSVMVSGLLALLLLTSAASAQTINFGDDSGRYANDNECDDPRFEGSGMAGGLTDEHRGHDATDCSKAVAAGTVSLIRTSKSQDKLSNVPAIDIADIDFGDNSSSYPMDGECDDLRFTGTGMADVLLDADAFRDADDCRTLFAAGKITLVPVDNAALRTVTLDDGTMVELGDNTSSYADNDECDDPRFEGEGVASILIEGDRLHDAMDCWAGLQKRTIALIADASTSGGSISYTLANGTVIDLGDNTSDYAMNQECDDPRFKGEGMAGILLDEDAWRDANDCQALLASGKIGLKPVDNAALVTVSLDDDSVVELGDNTSSYANNGECDDPRFTGTGMADILIEADRMHDAIDCWAGLQKRTIALSGDATTPAASTTFTAADGTVIDLGDNTSSYAGNGECDDPRFKGEGMAGILIESDKLHDSVDCLALLQSGKIALGPTVDGPQIYTLADGSTLDLGNNSSSYANNGECDDPRFEGTGVADLLIESDRLHDALDCRAQLDAGTITYLPAKEIPTTFTAADGTVIGLGDNTSEYANNDECDDPRFEGPGVADILIDSDRLHDSLDCQAQLLSGGITLIAGSDPATPGEAPAVPAEPAATPTSGPITATLTDGTVVDFGDNTSAYANNNECDDSRFEGAGMAAVIDSGDYRRDAADCKALFDAGTVTYGLIKIVDSAGIDFGDDAGAYPDDGECDDSSFEGLGVAEGSDDANVGHDATDCRLLFEAGRITLVAAAAPETAPAATPAAPPAAPAGTAPAPGATPEGPVTTPAPNATPLTKDKNGVRAP